MASFDFSKALKPSPSSKDVDYSDPIKFFYKLSHPAVTDLRPPQVDILGEWFKAYNTNQNDNVVSLNTGAGKTLVGLYVAESIRRSTEGKVLYVCPNNLLIKQTLQEAKKYGLRVSSYSESQWIDEESYLKNETICVTNYHAAFNSKSIFARHEIKGVIFDDSHIALELFDEQYTISLEDSRLIRDIAGVFSESFSIGHKIQSILEGDPQAIVMIPPLEWNQFNEIVRDKLVKAKIEGTQPFGWANIREIFSKTLCFITPSRLEISLLYPNATDHFIFNKAIHRVYLSATVPNLGDIIRVFGVAPTRIVSDKPDYRPERLFISPRMTQIEDGDNQLRKNLSELRSKALVLVPSNAKLSLYSENKIEVPNNSQEATAYTAEFKEGKRAILCLSNRYDGIDLPGETCHVLVVDGLPNSGDLKTRFFSEYFYNEKNSFLRSIIAAKLVQAFGRTIRSSEDYSIIFLLDDKLYRWIVNKDNIRFFKSDLIEDLDIGARVSSKIDSWDTLSDLLDQVLGRDQDWKKYIDSEREVVGAEGGLSPTSSEEEDVVVAKVERKIFDNYLSEDYLGCIEIILKNQEIVANYAKPMLGLYLSLASVCAFEIKDVRSAELSAQAYGIKPIFGRPLTDNDATRSIQTQRIVDYRGRIPNFSVEMSEPQFNVAVMDLGLALGFGSYRPENEDGSGTLDVCWYDEERKQVLGIENKIEKTNKILSKDEIDQCSGHALFLADEYPDFNRKVFVVGEFDQYNKLASPGELLFSTRLRMQELEASARELHLHKDNPVALEKKIDEIGLRIDVVFPKKLVASLTPIQQ